MAAGAANSCTAVTDPIAEVHVCAEALDVVGLATQLLGLAQHVVDA